MSFVTVTTLSQHQHHVHRRKREFVTQTINLNERDSLPKLTALISPQTTVVSVKTVTPTNSATSTSSSSSLSSSSSTSSSYTYSVTVIPNSETNAPVHSSQYDPYIQRTDLPDGLLFIIIGAIVGFALVLTILYRIITKIAAMRRAKSDSEKYEFTPNSLHLHSANPSLIDLSSRDRLSIYSASSMHLLSKNVAAMGLSLSLSLDSDSSTGGGRSYRNAINNGNKTNETHRGSMFISPVLEMLNPLNYKLPLNHKGAFDTYESSLVDDSTRSEMTDCGLLDSFVYSQDSLPMITERPRLSRPPSQLLDEILDLLPDFNEEEK